MADEVKRPELVVLCFHWEENGLQRQETYGPWTVAEDDAHLAQIRDFITGWRQATGIRPHAVTMALVTDPAEWAREREARAQLAQAYIGRGVVPESEIREMRAGG